MINKSLLNNNIDLKECPKGKSIDYIVNDEEYNAFNNAGFTSLILPIKYFDNLDIKTLDIINIKYKNKIILKMIVNDMRFAYYSIDELYEGDYKNRLEYTNIMNLNKAQFIKFIINKYNEDEDNFVLICLDIDEDYRDSKDLYI